MLQCRACESPLTAVQLFLSLFTDFENPSVFWPDPRHEGELNAGLDQLIACPALSRVCDPPNTKATDRSWPRVAVRSSRGRRQLHGAIDAKRPFAKPRRCVPPRSVAATLMRARHDKDAAK